jgi:hypothetical protein
MSWSLDRITAVLLRAHRARRPVGRPSRNALRDEARRLGWAVPTAKKIRGQRKRTGRRRGRPATAGARLGALWKAICEIAAEQRIDLNHRGGLSRVARAYWQQLPVHSRPRLPALKALISRARKMSAT